MGGPWRRRLSGGDLPTGKVVGRGAANVAGREQQACGWEGAAAAAAAAAAATATTATAATAATPTTPTTPAAAARPELHDGAGRGGRGRTAAGGDPDPDGPAEVVEQLGHRAAAAARARPVNGCRWSGQRGIVSLVLLLPAAPPSDQRPAEGMGCGWSGRGWIVSLALACAPTRLTQLCDIRRWQSGRGRARTETAVPFGPPGPTAVQLDLKKTHAAPMSRPEPSWNATGIRGDHGRSRV